MAVAAVAAALAAATVAAGTAAESYARAAAGEGGDNDNLDRRIFQTGTLQ
jgi:hypothetical protein